MSEVQALLYESLLSEDAFPLKHDCVCVYVHKRTLVFLCVYFYIVL